MKWEDIDQQVCSVARALSILGERWTLLIIRDAFRGTRRFDDFQAQSGRHAPSAVGAIAQTGSRRRPDASRLSGATGSVRIPSDPEGLGALSVLMTLSQWGDDWLDDGNGPPEHYRHSRMRQDHALGAQL